MLILLLFAAVISNILYCRLLTVVLNGLKKKNFSLFVVNFQITDNCEYQIWRLSISIFNSCYCQFWLQEVTGDPRIHGANKRQIVQFTPPEVIKRKKGKTILFQFCMQGSLVL